MSQKLFFLILFCFIFFIFSATISIAMEPVRQTESLVSVDHMAGFLEKIGEKISLFTRFGSLSKTKYLKELTEKRLAELKWTTTDQHYTQQDFLIEGASSRYSSYMGRLTDMTVTKGITADKIDMTSLVNRHRKILETIRDQFPANSAYWLLVQQNIDILKSTVDRISK